MSCPDVCVTRHAGKDSVREAFVSIWKASPDARWINDKHFVQGDSVFQNGHS